jgi:hypothetical protein
MVWKRKGIRQVVITKRKARGKKTQKIKKITESYKNTG